MKQLGLVMILSFVMCVTQFDRTWQLLGFYGAVCFVLVNLDCQKTWTCSGDSALGCAQHLNSLLLSLQFSIQWGTEFLPSVLLPTKTIKRILLSKSKER